MTALQLENKLANSYLTFIQNLSSDVKLDIISKISLSLIKKDEPIESEKPDSYFFGAWQSDETPEEFAESLRAARFFNRKQIEL
jgi:hypothetical protein